MSQLKLVVILASIVIVTLGTLESCKQKSSSLKEVPGSNLRKASAVYDICQGQPYPGEEGENLRRTGNANFQLAPAFLDRMQVCQGTESVEGQVDYLLTTTRDGQINEKGNCAFSNGVVCHYHDGIEFTNAGVVRRPDDIGELHCIVPNDVNPSNPNVFGGHVKCRQGTGFQPETVEERDGQPVIKNKGASCGFSIINSMSTCMSSRCCDTGSLTNPLVDLIEKNQDNARPNFRICNNVMEIDCASLVGMHPHPAHAPGLGGITSPKFGPTVSPKIAASANPNPGPFVRTPFSDDTPNPFKDASPYEAGVARTLPLAIPEQPLPGFGQQTDPARIESQQTDSFGNPITPTPFQ